MTDTIYKNLVVNADWTASLSDAYPHIATQLGLVVAALAGDRIISHNINQRPSVLERAVVFGDGYIQFETVSDKPGENAIFALEPNGDIKMFISDKGAVSEFKMSGFKPPKLDYAYAAFKAVVRDAGLEGRKTIEFLRPDSLPHLQEKFAEYAEK